ncbi:DoxX family protein [Kribbella deserti]|uniref:DoxX family membrane protein n=1 Tax=Kribbella deserti TaxID=1926257 RepID=A0ABV6QL53_9ACTN
MTVPVLALATLVFRVLGLLGVRRFATWRVSAAHGLAVMLVMTASAHFVPASVTVMPTHEDLVAIVPPFVPFAAAMVYLTGVLELAGAVGLVLGRTRRPAAYCLIALFVLLLPANIYAAVADVPFNGEAATPLWQRIPEQLLFIAVACWAASSRPAKSAEAASCQHTLVKV